MASDLCDVQRSGNSRDLDFYVPGVIRGLAASCHGNNNLMHFEARR